MEQFVKLSDVQKVVMDEVVRLAKDDFYSDYRQNLLKIIKPGLENLPSIRNPIAVLNEMKEELEIIKLKDCETIRQIWKIKIDTIKLAITNITKL